MESTILIFIVEDDFLIRDLLRHSLEEGGYSVEEATGAAQAIRMLETNEISENKYRAPITDIHLSEKQSGWGVARRARELNDQLHVIYMTGAGAHDWASLGVPKSILVNKPFASAQIVTAVSQLLNANETPGA